jgi:hypothetical protein
MKAGTIGFFRVPVVGVGNRLGGKQHLPATGYVERELQATLSRCKDPTAGSRFASFRVMRKVKFSEMWNLSQTMESAGHAVVSWFTCGACGHLLFGGRTSTGPSYARRQLRVTVDN